ncbi:MAG: helix-turn-helix transcriptional regulator [Alphaproteobacteria bacterium]|nr:helix-turn-helix transcriptional regulator [Alphaproteobacteria bacterium]
MRAKINREFERRRAGGLTKRGMAEKLDCDPALITKRLNGNANLTLETISGLAWALDCRPSFDLVPRDAMDRTRNAPTSGEKAGSERAHVGSRAGSAKPSTRISRKGRR